MKNKLEHILLSILLGLSVLLGLSFWLNMVFRFNIFCAAHWDEFARLQAARTPISTGFYVSLGVAILIFLIGIYLIYRPMAKRTVATQKPTNIVVQTQPKDTSPNEEKHEVEKEQTPEPVISTNRPPRLNLPTNMAQVIAQNYEQKPKPEQKPDTSSYNPTLSEIFSSNGYVVKPNPKMAEFVPNLFAIGNNEVVWIGGVDCEINKMMPGIQKLDSVFKETLEDIPININAFILDTQNKYNSENESVLIFKSIDELKTFINEHPADAIDETNQESFNSYSEYIDTIIQYIKNI